MVKYVTIAGLYKLLSLSPLTRRFYRFLGNPLGSRMRIKGGLSENYVNQGKVLINLLEDYCNIKKGDTILELGTGWVHWYSTFVRIFYDVEMTLFDVWDNRQLAPLKLYFSQLRDFLCEEPNTDYNRVSKLLDIISSVSSFEELYEMLGYKYLINKSGSLSGFSDNKFNIIFSVAVFEHINKDILAEYIRDIARILRPGGYSVHLIDIGDHYHYLDTKNTNMKEYFKYSKKFWKFYFENAIFYMNRVQSSE